MSSNIYNFAQTEYFELTRKQHRLVIISYTIMGAVIPITIQIGDLENQIGDPEKINIIEKGSVVYAMLSMQLSFVFSLLGLAYVTMSKRYDEIVRTLKRISYKFKDYFREDKKEGFVDLVWPLCHTMNFVVPSVLTMFCSVYLLDRLEPDDLPPAPIILMWILAVALTFFVMYAISLNWISRLQRRYERCRIYKSRIFQWLASFLSILLLAAVVFVPYWRFVLKLLLYVWHWSV